MALIAAAFAALSFAAAAPALARARPPRSGPVPRDAGFRLQWAERNTGQRIPGQGPDEVLKSTSAVTPGVEIGAVPAWSVTTGSPSVVIAELDTGVEAAHRDLAANIWSNPGGIGGCAAGSHGFNALNGTCETVDEDSSLGGHGTHVAGIMGALAGNGTGIAGIDWHARILPVKWLTSAATESDPEVLISALRWIVRARSEGVGIRVVNDSATFAGPPGAPSQIAEMAQLIGTLGAQGVLFVTSAGNSAADNDTTARYPCSLGLPNEICVTATERSDHLAPWANYGAGTVDLAAPGESIYSTLRGGGYGYLSGTSMAAAQVSAAAALLASARPSLSVAEMRAALVGGVHPLAGLAGKVRSGGRLDICRALAAATGACPVPYVESLRISPRQFAAAGGGPPILTGGGSGGALVTYTDSRRALTRITILDSRRRVLASVVHRESGRSNSVRITGRARGRRLPAGQYRLIVVPFAGSHPGRGASAVFRVRR